MSTTTKDTTEATAISGVTVPDSKLAREATELVGDTESPLLVNHSTRVYYFASLAGKKRGLQFDPELLYISAMFHDMGLTPQYSSQADRFEVDGANGARAFLRLHNVSQQDIDTVWTAITLHATPGIPQHMHPVVALVTNGVEMDVLGIAYSEFSDANREAIVAAYPRTEHFREETKRDRARLEANPTAATEINCKPMRPSKNCVADLTVEFQNVPSMDLSRAIHINAPNTNYPSKGRACRPEGKCCHAINSGTKDSGINSLKSALAIRLSACPYLG